MGVLAIDTVRLESPFITDELAIYIENQSIRRQGLDLKSGELLYQIVTSDLRGSFDSRIMIQVKRDKLGYNTELKRTMKLNTDPYLVVEASVHKAILGHNVFGGPVSFRRSVMFLIGLIEELLELEKCTLPFFDNWIVRRVDVAEVYKMDSFEVCQEWFRGLNSCEYPRRSVDRYGLSGLYATGSTTALKFYHKGPEFWKHDRKRLLLYMEKDKVDELQLMANNIIRVETEIKSRKLKLDYGLQPLVKDVTDEYLNRVHDREVERLLRDGKKQMTVVRNARGVQKRLYEVYGSRKAKILFGTWMELSAFGRKAVKESMGKSSFYNHVKWLEEAGVDYKLTDVQLKEQHSIVPEDFSPVRTDIRRIREEATEVKEVLYLVS